MAWTVPAIAVASTVPTAAASLLPCVDKIAPVGGTYPVSLSLSGCNVANSHWDFNFKIRAAVVDCDCERVRITMYDNPKRSRLWISNSSVVGNPSTNTANTPQLYIQKELAPGAEATFPAPGDPVKRVDNNNLVGSIGAHGTADDSLHTLINPAGGAVPCTAAGPMATYKVECRKVGETGWTQVGEELGIINPCVPMIQVVSVCRYDSAGNDRYRLGISVLNSCGKAPEAFRITNIQRNNDSNFPNQGTSVWSGSQQLSNAVTYIDTALAGQNGSSLWVSFTTDNGANTSIMRVSTNNTNCR